MSELANYSIETDHSVWLSFKDGRNFRVTFGQLPKYLAPRDLSRVRRAIKLRHDFLRHHMPRTLVALLALGILAALFAGSSTVAHLLKPPGSLAPASKPEVVRNMEPTNSLPQTTPVAPVKPAAPVATKPSRQMNAPATKRAAKVLPAPTLQPPIKLIAPVIEITPIIPAPGLPGETAPTPSPLPSPLPDPAVGSVKSPVPAVSPVPAPK